MSKLRLDKNTCITPEDEKEAELLNSMEEILKDIDALKKKVEELKKKI